MSGMAMATIVWSMKVIATAKTIAASTRFLLAIEGRIVSGNVRAARAVHGARDALHRGRLALVPACVRAGQRRGSQAVEQHRQPHRGVDHERRSEEHTSELQSHVNLVCRLLL